MGMDSSAASVGTADASVSVLVADDDPTSRLLVGAALDGHVGGVSEAENGLEAVQALERHHYDIAIVDLDMPVMDGFGVIERARAQARTKHLPILVVTGRDDVVAIERAFALGATSFLCKPINWAVFRHQVSYVLQVARAERETRRGKEKAEMLAAVRQRSLTAVEKEVRIAAQAGGATTGRSAAASGPSGSVVAQLQAVLARVNRADEILRGEADFDPQPISAAVLAEAAVARVAALLGTETAARIVSEPNASQLLADRRLTVDALTEILVNALAYSPATEPVRLACVDAPPGRVRFEIEDRGPGIPEHILDAGVGSLPTLSGNRGGAFGLGLGLASAKAIIDRHGGHLGIMSEIGRGTEVFLSFPAARAGHGKELLKQIAQMSPPDFPEWGGTAAT